MKTILKNTLLIKVIMLFLFSICIRNAAHAQDKQQDTEKKQATVKLSFYKKADQIRFITANVSALNDSGKRVFVNNAKIDFYFSRPSGEMLLASVFTDVRGKASTPIPGNLSADTSGLSFIARLKNNRIYSDAEATGTIKNASIVIRLSEKDSSKLITAMVTEVQMNKEEKPVANAEVSFGVKRLLGIMPLSEEATVTTNEQGIATFVLPKKIKGDEKGKIMLVASLNDNEQYGTVEAITPALWGAPIMPEKNPFPRALWEPKAPLLLIVVFSIIFGGVWFTYGTVVYRISKIEKITPASKT